MSVKFVRHTHNTDGSYRFYDEHGKDVSPPVSPDVSFIVHMLDVQPMSLDEIVSACHQYAYDHHEEPLSMTRIIRALEKARLQDVCRVVDEQRVTNVRGGLV